MLKRQGWTGLQNLSGSPRAGRGGLCWGLGHSTVPSNTPGKLQHGRWSCHSQRVVPVGFVGIVQLSPLLRRHCDIVDS